MEDALLQVSIKKQLFFQYMQFLHLQYQITHLAGYLSANNKHKFNISQVVCIDNYL